MVVRKNDSSLRVDEVDQAGSVSTLDRMPGKPLAGWTVNRHDPTFRTVSPK